MSSLTVSDEHATATKAKVIQPAWVRALHWTNAFAMVLMIMSGWQIYNASPLFGFSFSSSITLGGLNPGRFAQTHTCTIGGAGLAPGGSCTITVTFTPNRRVARSATLNIRDNASPTLQTVTLTGTGI